MAGLAECTAEQHLGCMAKAAGRVYKSLEGEAMRTESMKLATASRKEGGKIGVQTDMTADKMSGLRNLMTGVGPRTFASLPADTFSLPAAQCISVHARRQEAMLC